MVEISAIWIIAIIRDSVPPERVPFISTGRPGFDSFQSRLRNPFFGKSFHQKTFSILLRIL